MQLIFSLPAMMKRFLINPKGKVFINNATHYIGSRVASKLNKENYEVMALTRDENKAARLFGQGFNPVISDLFALSPIDLEGCDTVIHIAETYRNCKDFTEFEKLNIAGTEHILLTARQAGVKRFIFIASETLLSQGVSLDNIDESQPYTKESIFPHTIIKERTEEIVLAANEDGVFETISLRPRLIWGEESSPLLLRILKLIENRKLIWIDGGNYLYSFTHIENLVQAIMLSLKKGKGGNAYFIADKEVHKLKEFLTQYLDIQKIKFNQRTVGLFWARSVLSSIHHIYSLILNKESKSIFNYTMMLLSANSTVNIQKAKNDLAYEPKISFREAISKLQKLHGLL